MDESRVNSSFLGNYKDQRFLVLILKLQGNHRGVSILENLL